MFLKIMCYVWETIILYYIEKNIPMVKLSGGVSIMLWESISSSGTEKLVKDDSKTGVSNLYNPKSHFTFGPAKQNLLISTQATLL